MRAFSTRMKLAAVVILAALFGISSASFARIIVNGGTVLNKTGIALTTSYTTGTSTIMQGSEDADFTVTTTLKASTSITSVSYQIVISDDNSTWLPIQALCDSTGTTSATYTFTPTAGQITSGGTFSDHIRTQNHRDAKYTNIQVKIAGTGAVGDAATATVNYSYSN